MDENRTGISLQTHKVGLLRQQAPPTHSVETFESSVGSRPSVVCRPIQTDRSYSPPHNEPVGTRNHPQHAPNLKNAPEGTRMLLLNFNSIRALELSVE